MAAVDVSCLLLTGLVTFLTSKNRISPFLSLVNKIGLTFVFLNSSLNPLLYCWKIRELKSSNFGAVRLNWNFQSTPTVWGEQEWRSGAPPRVFLVLSWSWRHRLNIWIVFVGSCLRSDGSVFHFLVMFAVISIVFSTMYVKSNEIFHYAKLLLKSLKFQANQVSWTLRDTERQCPVHCGCNWH